MRKSRFTDAQIIGMIKEQKAGMATADVCRKLRVSTGTFCKYKARLHYTRWIESMGNGRCSCEIIAEKVGSH